MSILRVCKDFFTATLYSHGNVGYYGGMQIKIKSKPSVKTPSVSAILLAHFRRCRPGYSFTLTSLANTVWKKRQNVAEASIGRALRALRATNQIAYEVADPINGRYRLGKLNG